MKYWVGLLTIIVFIVLLALVNLYSSEMQFDGNSAGVLISALGVMVTALVGWQVYNAIEMRGVIREFDALKGKVEAYNTNQSFALDRVDNLHTAQNCFKECKNQSLILSQRYLKAAKAAESFLRAGVSPIDSQFTLTISQLEHILELSEIITQDKIGDFNSLHTELDKIYKFLIRQLASYKGNIEQLIVDVNECHSKRLQLQ